MRPIRVLPPELVNQIKAGEVLERPASAVKELLENSLDAGARRIAVEATEGGRDLLRVVDDGVGIPAAELALAVTRHATSKLESLADFERVRTLGFRGEALASMAGVSQLVLRSRPVDQETAAEVEVDHGRVGSVRECGAPPGTQIEIRRLFAEVPVRRKFLKSKQTELGHITEAMTRLALAFPAVGFQLVHNDKLVLERAAGLDRRTTIRQLFGPDVADAMLAVDWSHGPYRVTGFVAHPRVDRGTSRHQYLFVNHRWIRDRSLAHALVEAYRGLVMVGRHPVAFLFLELPPEDVDVNVHPTKTEVRFVDPHRAFSAVLAAVRTRLNSSDLVTAGRLPRAEIPLAAATSEFEADDAASLSEEMPDRRLDSPAFERGETPPVVPRRDERRLASSAPAESAPLPFERPIPPTARPASPKPSNGALPQAAAESHHQAIQPRPRAETALGDLPVRALQLHNAYLVVEDADGMLLIDQHALHERILYEEFKRRLATGTLEAQELLVPEPVTLPPAQTALVLECRDLLEKLGLRVEEFGDRCALVRSVPALVDRLTPAALLREIAEHLEQTGATPEPAALLEDALAMMACKAAVKVGDPLTPDEIEALLARRHLVNDSHHCPHGRPTVLRFTMQDLARQFRRT